MLHKAWNSKGEMPYCFPRSAIKFQGHTVQNITDFDPNWAFPDYRPVAAFKSLRFALLTMFPSSYHHEIFRSYYQWQKWRPCKRSRSEVKGQVTEVMTPFSRFRTVTPVYIHILRWNDAYSLMLLRRGALLFFKVIRQISRSHGSKNRWIWPKLGVSGL